MAASGLELTHSPSVRSKSLDIIGLSAEATDDEARREYMTRANEWIKEYKNDKEKDPDADYFCTLTRAFTFIMANIDEEEFSDDDLDREFYTEDEKLIFFLKMYENLIFYGSCVCEGCMLQYILKKEQFKRPEKGARIIIKPNCCMVISSKRDERKLPRACSHHKGIDEKYQFSCELNGEEIKFTRSVKKKLKQLKPKWQEPEPSVKWFKKQEKKYWNAILEPTVSTYKRPILGMDQNAANKNQPSGSDTESQDSATEKEDKDGLNVKEGSKMASSNEQKCTRQENSMQAQQKPKKQTKKQLEAEQRKREKEMAAIAEELKKHQEKEIEKLKKMEEKEKLRQREVNILKDSVVDKKEKSSDQEIRDQKRREEKKQKKLEMKSKSKKKREAKQLKRMENVKKETVKPKENRKRDSSELNRKGSSDSVNTNLQSKKPNKPKSNFTSNTAVTQVIINSLPETNQPKPIYKEPQNPWKPIPKEVKIRFAAPPKYTTVAPRYEAQMQEKQINTALKVKIPQKHQTVVNPSTNAWGRKDPMGNNVWQERQEFYHAVIPQSQKEEEAMLKAALEMSLLQQEEEKLKRKIADEECQIEMRQKQTERRETEARDQVASYCGAPDRMMQNQDACEPVINTVKPHKDNSRKSGLARNSSIAQEAQISSNLEELSDQDLLEKDKLKQLDCHNRLRQFAKSFASDLKSEENISTAQLDELVWEEKDDSQTDEIHSESSFSSVTTSGDSTDADDELQSQEDSSSVVDSPQVTNIGTTFTSLTSDFPVQASGINALESFVGPCKTELEEKMTKVSISERSHKPKCAPDEDVKRIQIHETSCAQPNLNQGVGKKKSSKADIFGKSLCANVSRLCRQSDDSFKDFEHHSKTSVIKEEKDAYAAKASHSKARAKEKDKSVDIKNYLPPTPPKSSEISNSSNIAASLGLPDVASFDGYINSFHPSMMFPNFHSNGYNMMPLGVPPIGHLPNSLNHPTSPVNQNKNSGNSESKQNVLPSQENVMESPPNVDSLKSQVDTNFNSVDQKHRTSSVDSPQINPLLNPSFLSASMGMFPYLGMRPPLLNMPTINPQLLPSFMTGQPSNLPAPKPFNNDAMGDDQK